MFEFLESERFPVHMSSISELARINASAVASYSRDRDHMASDEAWPGLDNLIVYNHSAMSRKITSFFGTSSEDSSVPVTSAKSAQPG